MGKLLNSGAIGTIQTSKLQNERKQIVEVWKKTKLLNGLKDEHTTGVVAQLLENQAAALLREAANVTGNIEGFDVVAFPLVRRVFGKLLANEIVSVQPLNLPSGLIFYVDAQIGTSANRTNSAYSTVYDAHYNNGARDYSMGAATAASGLASTFVNWTNATTTIPLAITATSPSTFEQVMQSLQVWGISGASAWPGATSNKLEITRANYTLDPQTWMQDLDGTAYTINIKVTALPGAAYSAIGATWLNYASQEAVTAMQEVKLVVKSVPVQVTSRKMKAHWTPELAQDLAAYHSIDAEAELTALLSEELGAEIDREIIADLIIAAPYTTTWAYSMSGAAYSGYQTQKVHNQTLLTEINKISNQIHKRTLRGGANFIVCSTEVASVFDDLDNFHGLNETETEQFNLGIENIGNLQSRYTVYKDPFLPADVCLIGRKGTSWLDTGYVYAPYIPFQLTPVINDPDDFTPRKGIMTRYAKKVVNNKFYGRVYVNFPGTYYVTNGS